LWGIAGLLFNTPILLGPVGLIIQGPSMPGLLYWIGGMLLFGLGMLAANSNYDFKRPTESGER
jgi:hypothetical protein